MPDPRGASSDYAHSNSRIADANRSWKAACDASVAGWAKPDEFIIAMLVTTAAHAAAAESFRLEWKKGAGGAWNLLQAGAGEIRQGTNTVLIDGNPLDDTKDSGCQAWADIDASEEVEGDDTTAAASCGKANYMEFQFAVDPSNAAEAQDYYFRLYSITGAAALGEAASSITIAGTGSAELLAQFKISRESYRELGAVFSVAAEDTRDLKAILRVAQDSEDLSTKLIVAQATSRDLLSRFTVVMTGTRSLLAGFYIPAFASEELPAKFEVGRGSAELLGKTVITIPWISGWAYRQIITLVEQAGGTYNDYPTIITVAYDPHMKNDFSDCRFTEADGTTLIPYGIVEKTNGVSCSFVIKRDYTPGCTLDVYLYYGNPDAVDASVDHGPWALAWYLANGFGQNPSAYTDTNCTLYPHSASEAIPAWAAIVFGGCTANGGYRAFYGRTKINGVAAAWASTAVCNGIANALQLKWKKYSCTNEQYDHGSFVSGASNTVTWGHYSGGDTGFWVSYYPTDPSVSFGGEAGSESEDLLGKFEVGQGARDLLVRLAVGALPDSEDLPARLTVSQPAENLSGEFIVRQEASEDLLGKFDVTLPPGMEQVLFGSIGTSEGLLDPTVTEYNSLVGGRTAGWTTSSSWVRKLVSTDGVIKQLRFVLRDVDGNPASPGAGKKYTFTLYLNGNPTALTFDIEDAETSGSDMVNEVTVTGGDYVFIRCVPTGTPTARYAYWTSVFEGDTPNESLILGGTGFGVNNLATEFCQVMCGYTNFSTTENNFRQIVPTSGIIKNFYVRLGVDPGTAPDAYRFTVRLNGATVAQSLIVTIVANDITGSDLVHNLAVAAGDVLTMMVEPLNTPSETMQVCWGMTFVADIDGESIVMRACSPDLDDTATEYNFIVGYEASTWISSENSRYCIGQVCILKKLYILLSGSPGAGNKYDFTLRIAGANSNVVATVSDAAITGNSGALEDTVADDDYVTLQVVPTDTPTVRDAYWGFVCYIPPPLPDTGSADLLAKFAVRQEDSANLLGKLTVGILSSLAELLCRGEIRRLAPPTELLGKAEIQQSESADLLVRFEVGQDSEGLPGKLTVRHSTSVDLPAKSITRHADDVDLPSVSEIRNLASADLRAKIDVTHSVTLPGRCVVRHVGIPVDLLGGAKIRQAGVPLELSAKFQVMHWKVLLTKSWIRHHHYLWTNRHYVNGVVELDEENLTDPFLGYVIQGVMDDLKSWLINEGMLDYDSWTDITRTPKLIRRATTYGTVASLYARDANNPHRRIVMGLRLVRLRAVEERAASERAMDYWETRMEKMMTLYLTAGGRRLMFVDTEDEEPVFSMDDIPFYTEDPY